MRPLGAKRRKPITDQQMVRPTGQVARKFTKAPPERVVGSLQGTTYGGTRWQDSHKWARYRELAMSLSVSIQFAPTPVPSRPSLFYPTPVTVLFFIPSVRRRMSVDGNMTKSTGSQHCTYELSNSHYADWKCVPVYHQVESRSAVQNKVSRVRRLCSTGPIKDISLIY